MSSAPESSGLGYRDLQRWFFERIVAPHRRGAAPVGDSAGVPERSAAQVVLPSSSLTPDERVHIYAEQYMWRLIDVARDEHPALSRLLGDQFDELVTEYIARFPPRSHTVKHVCHALPHFLQRSARADALLLWDMARLERAVSDAYDTYPVGAVTGEDLAEVPPEAWPMLRFRMDPSVRAMAFAHDAVGIYDAVKQGEPLPDLQPVPSYGLVWRHDNKIWRQAISRPRYETLAALAAGETVTDALERAAEVWEGGDDELESTIFRWFSEWVEEGFFSSLVLPRHQL